MTKLPHENRNVVGLDGPEYPSYRVGPLCSVPGCSRLADHVHHIWRRSFVVGDKPWVRLWNDAVVGNLTGLCWRHHNAVTEGKTQIIWSGEYYLWADEDGSQFLLEPQPPHDPAPEYVEEDFSNVEHLEDHVHGGPAQVEKCPTCKRRIPQKREKTEEKRSRKSWTITVPVDHRENGADVLDALLEECAVLFEHDESKSVRYFTLAQALALVVQHGERMVGAE